MFLPNAHRRIFLIGVAVAAGLFPAAAARADADDVVRASPAEVSQALFVAGDVRRLSRNPSGTVDTVLERVLQQRYRDDPSLEPEEARRSIESLRDGLARAGAATSTATLAIQPGNQRVLAILAGLRRSKPPAPVARAITELADTALTESSKTARPPADAFSATVDAQSTLLYGSFSPAATLTATVRLAVANPRFARARDAVWADAAKERLSDDADALLAANPELRNDGVRALVAGRAGDGSLSIPVGDIETRIRNGLNTINAQNGIAMTDHRTVVQTCPGAGCQDSRDGAREDAALARGRIAAEQATLAASGALLAQINARYAEAIQAEAQAAAQVANGVNSYFAAQDYGEILHAASDAAGLVLSLAVAQVHPVAAVTGVVSVVAEILDASAAGPDANALILQGLQGVSQQLSAFAMATSAQFAGLDERLERLTRDVGVLADRLSTQLTDLRTQLNGFGGALLGLQGSVDRLNNEIKLLFAQGARNDLDTVTSQYLGRGGLDTRDLPTPAGALYADAARIAFSPTVLNTPAAYDAQTVAGLGDLNPNVNFFALFPRRVADSTAGLAWPPALDDTCRDCQGSPPPSESALPDPAFWAASSRAYAQLLLENRNSVTRDRLDQLDALLSGGAGLKEAFGHIADNDDGTRGTGSKLFNAVLDYYRSWYGDDADRTTGPPTLLQAIRAVQKTAIEDLPHEGVKSTRPWIDPYGDARQSLDGVDVAGFPQFMNFRTQSGYVLKDLRGAPAVLNWLPIEIRNAVRLGIVGVRPSVFVTRTSEGFLFARLSFTLTGAGPDIRLGSLDWETSAADCAGNAEQSVAMGWTGVNGCPYLPDGFNFRAIHGDPQGQYIDTSGFARGVAAVEPLINTELDRLRDIVLSKLVTSDSTLTPTLDRDSNVDAAAQRLGGARALLRAYVALGLPQALATDDTLRGLIAGDASNPLLHPYGDARTAVPADDVPGQVAHLLTVLRHDHAVADPAGIIGSYLRRHAADLTAAIRPYVLTGRAANQSPADGGRLDEANPLVASTIDRLELTRDVLADHLDHPPTTPAATPTPTPETTSPAPQAPTADAPAS
ncbi:MAG TPA: hypothetical protein VI300_24705, partial [Solirubrobacter sp.]